MKPASRHELPRYQSSEMDIPGDEWLEHPRAQFTDHVSRSNRGPRPPRPGAARLRREPAAPATA